MLPDILPGWASLAPFLLATLALNLTPGADMTYTIARSAAQGRVAGYASAMGIGLGCFVHTVAAAAGLAALLQAHPAAFQAVKWIGAAYLLYLAFKLLLAKPTTGGADLPARGHARVFWEATLVNVLNPKVAIFMLAFLPQFVDPTRGPVWAQMLVLGSLLNVGGIAINSTVASLVGLGAQRIQRSTRLQRAMNLVSGTLLGGLAVRLALIER
ncbi:LysE family translocator [Rhodovibrio salinarum]|uniref:LysE family translocator n=1 Tax=Rhodovibrio salinarum TaxID=1087 RepID=A0A934QI69_9PROT|nr:LysE family translocator [Rhodovibrio salinarum]MBK1697354.1 LysE family translocator [Rhodovibrio salinarum]